MGSCLDGRVPERKGNPFDGMLAGFKAVMARPRESINLPMGLLKEALISGSGLLRGGGLACSMGLS